MPRAKEYINVTFVAEGADEASVQGMKAQPRFEHCYVKWSSEGGLCTLKGYIHLRKKASLQLTTRLLAEICKCPVTVTRGQSSRKADVALIREGGCIEWDYSTLASSAMDVDAEVTIPTELPKEWAKYHEGYAIVRDAAAQRDEQMKAEIRLTVDEPQLWQRRAWNRLRGQREDQVHWYVDKIGGNGKTWLAKWLMTTQGAYYVSDGRNEAIIACYKLQDYVVIDLKRYQERCPPWSLIEGFKSGFLYYEGGVKLKVGGAKIIVLSNWKPERNAMEDYSIAYINLPEQDPFTIEQSLIDAANQNMCDESIFADLPDLIERAPSPPDARDLITPPKRSRAEMQSSDL